MIDAIFWLKTSVIVRQQKLKAKSIWGYIMKNEFKWVQSNWLQKRLYSQANRFRSHDGIRVVMQIDSDHKNTV